MRSARACVIFATRHLLHVADGPSTGTASRRRGLARATALEEFLHSANRTHHARRLRRKENGRAFALRQRRQGLEVLQSEQVHGRLTRRQRRRKEFHRFCFGVRHGKACFRESLRAWLLQTMRADVYVSAPGAAEGPAGRLEPQVIQALLATPGIRSHSEARRVVVSSAHGQLDLDAINIPNISRNGFRLTQGDPAAAWAQFARGAILISEPLAWRLALTPHDTLTLTTASGARAFTVAGVYREYGNDRGEVLMDLAEYRRLFRDDAIGALGIYLAPGVSAASAVGALSTHWSLNTPSPCRSRARRINPASVGFF